MQDKREESKLSAPAAGGDEEVDVGSGGVQAPRRSIAGHTSMYGSPDSEGGPGRELSHYVNASIMSRVNPGGMGARSLRMSLAGSVGNASGTNEVRYGEHAYGGGAGGNTLGRQRSGVLGAIRADAAAGGSGSINLERLLCEMQLAMDRQNKELVGLRRTMEVLARGAAGDGGGGDASACASQVRRDSSIGSGSGLSSWANSRSMAVVPPPAAAALAPRRDAQLPGSPPESGGSNREAKATERAAAAGVRPMTTPAAGAPKSGGLDAEQTAAAASLEGPAASEPAKSHVAFADGGSRNE